MFGSAPTFSELVQEFDARLDQLSWNDGNSISYLTNRARAAPPSDVDILTTCILFRIITVRRISYHIAAENALPRSQSGRFVTLSLRSLF